MVVRDLACHVISLNAGCLWVTPSAIPGLHCYLSALKSCHNNSFLIGVVSRLMDVLVDAREVLRNDALLLLIQLTKGHANLQKIVAFENAFDKLCDIMETVSIFFLIRKDFKR